MTETMTLTSETLARSLDGPDEDETLLAIAEAMDEGRSKDVGLLVERLSRPAGGRLRAALVKAIGVLGSREHAGLLGAFTADADDDVRFSAQEAVELLSGLRPPARKQPYQTRPSGQTPAETPRRSRRLQAVTAAQPAPPSLPPDATSPPPAARKSSGRALAWESFLSVPKAPSEPSPPVTPEPSAQPAASPAPAAPRPRVRRPASPKRPLCVVCGEPIPAAATDCPSCGEKLRNHP